MRPASTAAALALDVARQTAEHLDGWDWGTQAPEGHDAALTHTDGRRIGITVAGRQARFAGLAPLGPRTLTRSIGVRADRGGEVFADHVRRRLLPMYAEMLAVYFERSRQAAADAKVRESLVLRLIEHLPRARENGFASTKRTAHVYWPSPWRSPNAVDRISHDADSDRFGFNLADLPEAAARRMSALVDRFPPEVLALRRISRTAEHRYRFDLHDIPGPEGREVVALLGQLAREYVAQASDR